MQHRKDSDGLHITLDDGEDERQVLRALVKAGYKCSYDRPASSRMMDGDLTDAQADRYILKKDRGGRERAVDMVIVEHAEYEGHWLDSRLVVDKLADGHFLLDLKRFESGVVHYHEIGSLLDLAKRVLSGAYGQFKNEDLDRRLTAFDIRRGGGEKDWDLRKRAFLALWPKAPVEALEFLYGCAQDKLSSTDKSEIQELMQYGLAHQGALESFAESRGIDPMVRRADQYAFLSIFG